MSGPPAVAPGRRRVVTSYDRWTLAVVVVVVVWRAWTMSRWTWDGDDWVYMADARAMGFWTYLFQGYKGHLMPAEFLLSWVLTRVAPMTFGVAIALVAAGSGYATYLWSRALAAVAGPRPVVLLPLVLLSFTPLLIRPTIWWASALQVVPLQVFTALTVLAAARYAASESKRDLVWLLLATAGGLLFWEKAVLLVIPALGVLVHCGSGTLWTRTRRAVVPAVLLGALVAAYSALYLQLARSPEGERNMGLTLGADRSPATMFDFFSRGLADLLAPGLLGGPWGTLPLSNEIFFRPPAAVAWGCTIVVIVAIACASRVAQRRSDVWVPASMAIAYALVAWGLVLYSSRFDVVQLAAINDERYVVDSFAIAVLAVVMSMRPALGAPAGSGVTTPPSPRRKLVVRLVGAGLCVSLLAGNVAAVVRIGTHPGKGWVSQALTDLKSGEPISVLDGYAPERVLPPAFWQDDARLSRMFLALPGVSFDGPADQLHAVDDTGHVQPVDLDASSTMPDGPVDDCGYAIEAGETVRAPMSASLFALDWLVQVDTLAAQGGTLTVDLGDRAVSMAVGPGLSQHQFAYRGEVGRAVTLSMSPDSGTVCVIGVGVGNPEVTPER